MVNGRLNKTPQVYDKLCQNHSNFPKNIFSIKNLGEAKKWRVLFGSDVARQFLGSLLKGKQLSRDDASEYEGMCLEGNKPFAQVRKISIGTHNGFGKINPSVFNCMPNDEVPGSIKCLDYNVETKFQATLVAHFMDTELQNCHIVVDCYANIKEVGWVALSPSPSLTNEEYASLKKEIVALGFDEGNIVPMYDEKCNIEEVLE